MGISTTDNYTGPAGQTGWWPQWWRLATRSSGCLTSAHALQQMNDEGVNRESGRECIALQCIKNSHSKTRTNVIIKYHQSMCVGLSSFQCLSSSSVDGAPTVWAQLFPRSSAMKNDLVLVRWLNVDRGWDFLRSSLIVHCQCQVWRRRPLGRLQLLGGLRHARSARLWSSAWSARVTWPNSLNRLCPLMTVQCCN